MTTKTRWNDERIETTLKTSGEQVPARAATPESREFIRLYTKASPQARRQISHLVSFYEARNKRAWASWLYHWLAFFAINPSRAIQSSASHRRVFYAGAFIALGFAVMLIAGCSGDTGGGSVRATAEALGTRYPTAAAPATSEPAVIATWPAQVVEATRIVVQPVAVTVMVTREVVVTATPDVAGFDESAQPCPARFWRGGRCTATQAQIEAAANESK